MVHSRSVPVFIILRRKADKADYGCLSARPRLMSSFLMGGIKVPRASATTAMRGARADYVEAERQVPSQIFAKGA